MATVAICPLAAARRRGGRARGFVPPAAKGATFAAQCQGWPWNGRQRVL